MKDVLFMSQIKQAIDNHLFGKYHSPTEVDYCGDDKLEIGCVDRDYNVYFYVAKHWCRRDTERVIKILKENGVKASTIHGGVERKFGTPYLYLYFDKK